MSCNPNREVGFLFYMRLLAAVLTSLVLSAGQLSSQTTTKISGQILDQATLSPLSGATVLIRGTAYSTTTDNYGLFSFENLPVGEYRLTFRSLGYQPRVSYP